MKMRKSEMYAIGLIDHTDDVIPPTVLSMGMGVNSVAIICGMIEKGYEPPDAILFADTGEGNARPGEKPHTYAYIDILNAFLRRHKWPGITVLRKGGNGETLEENCLRMTMLPSLAYGMKGCSQKYKVRPQEVWANKRFKRYFKAGGKVVKLLGYDFLEERRWMAAKVEDDKYWYQFPLVEWEWDRKDCKAAILRAGLPLPGKSACFFCPASTLADIESLRVDYPHLLQRACRMEFDAMRKLKSIFGLGRRFSWIEHLVEKHGMDGAVEASGLTHAEIVQFKGRRVIPISADNDNVQVCGYCVDFENAAA